MVVPQDKWTLSWRTRLARVTSLLVETLAKAHFREGAHFEITEVNRDLVKPETTDEEEKKAGGPDSDRE